MQDYIELISSQIQEAELVLVGIGERFISGETVERLKRAYKSLSRLLEGKNYFIITACTDDLIYEAGLKGERIVRPRAEEETRQEEEIRGTGSAAQTEHELRPSRWETYMKWLQGTLNRRLLVLEMGVGLAYPDMIRFPFEKIVYYNRKAYFIRVHDKLFQLPAELNGRGTPVPEDAVAMLATYEK